MTRIRLPPPVWRILQGCVAIGLLWLVWHVADGAKAMGLLAGAKPAWLLAAVAVLTLQTVLSALRWRLTAAQLGISMALPTALREYYLSQIVNQTLPGGMLGDAGRAVRTRQTAGLMASVQAVVFERLAGQIALFGVLAAGFLATLLVPNGLDWPVWARRSVGGLIAAGLTLPGLLWAVGRVSRSGAAKKLTDQGAALWHALFAPDVRVRQAGFSLGAVLCNIAGFGFCIWAVGVNLTIPAIMALGPLILFAMVVPVTISGWGLREGAAAALFPIAGASASDGLAASIAFGLVFLAAVLPGIVLIFLGTGWRPTKL
jgi:uncharacterized membrane protein YbhN (UPF0104 family)